MSEKVDKKQKKQEAEVRSVRMTQEDYDKLKAFFEESGYSQAAGFAAIVSMVEVQKACKVIPNKETEIAEVSSHAHAIIEAYLKSLERCENAVKDAHEGVDRELKSQAKTIADYQAKVEELTSKAAEADKLAAQNAKLEERVAELKQSNALLDKEAKAAQHKAGKYDKLKEDFDALEKKYADLEKSTERDAVVALLSQLGQGKQLSLSDLIPKE